METIYACFNKALQELRQLTKDNPPVLALLLVLLTIPLNYAVNSIAMALFVLISLLYAKKAHFKLDLTLLLPVFLYALMLLTLLWTADFESSFKALSKELPILIFAVCFMSFSVFGPSEKQLLVRYFSFGMCMYMFYFLTKAIVRYFITKDSSVFFYHELVTEDLNAIHVSVYMSFAFFYFYTKNKRTIAASIIAVLLAVFVFLLASKNVILVFVMLLIVFEVFYSKAKLKPIKTIASLVVFVLIIVLFSTKIKERLWLEWKTNTTENTIVSGTSVGNIVHAVTISQAWSQDKFKQNDFFPGAAFRVYQARIFKEMLIEDPIFFTGYGLNATNFKLVEKGKEHTVFSGDATHGGYQNNNFHNQYIQIFAETGVFGFILLLLIVSLSLRNAIKSKDFISISFTVLMISLFLTESFLSRQRGVVFFMIWICVFNTNRIVKPFTKL